MMYTDIQPTQQLQLPITVKEELVTPARKRVTIVSVKLVKEGNLYYANRTIRISGAWHSYNSDTILTIC